MNRGGERLGWWLDAEEAQRLERWNGPLTHVWFDSTAGRAYVRTFTF